MFDKIRHGFVLFSKLMFNGNGWINAKRIKYRSNLVSKMMTKIIALKVEENKEGCKKWIIIDRLNFY